jgi:pyruvate,water dikinase
MIYGFKVDKLPEISQVGGKGKALIEMTKAGFPVPEGIVLSVDYFNDWMIKIKELKEWSNLLRSITKENCDALKSIILKEDFADEMKRSLKEEIITLDGQLFAVRSSSPEEDLEGTSFAGMYDTLLGQKKDMLESAIKETFASCFDFRVMSYKERLGIDIEKTSIAVIVQKQIASDISGVAFSLNPLNNAFDEVLINASFGLGEAIVSGIVTPDFYTVDSISNKIIDKKINNKELALRLGVDGGIEEGTVINSKEQALSDQEIISLSRLVKECEKHYAMPMDIEWAYENGHLYLLQSRPITTYNPFFSELVTKPGDDKKIYIDVMGMTQGFTKSMSVLGGELWGLSVEAIKGEVMICDINGTTPTLHGRQYFNVSHTSLALGNKFVSQFLNSYDGNIKRIFENINMEEYKVKELPEILKGAKKGIFSMILKVLPSILKAYFGDYKKVMKEYDLMAEGIMKDADTIDPLEDFEVSVRKLTSQFEKIMSSAGFAIGPIKLQSLKRKFKGMDVDEEFVALSMDLKGNPTSDMGKLQYKLASYEEFQRIDNREKFIESLENKTFSKEFIDDFNTYIKKYGVRGFMEIDVASKRKYEDLPSVYDELKEINIEENLIITTTKRRKKAYDKLLSIAKDKGFAKKFELDAKKFQETFGYREHPKYMIVYAMGKLHDAALVIGNKFVKEGRLDNPHQIFDLTLNEISNAQKDSNINLQLQREKNLAPYKKVSHVKDWPLVIDSRGKIFKAKLEINEGDIKGDPIAPGKIKGRAKVLNSPYEKPLNPGEILITKCTEPSWTPIFINAAGVIMEVGGPLQHGGIIAREYGIPCVSGLMGIMEMIKDGDLIELDGSNGIVRILER